jgi:hypothetical protein
MEATEGGPMEIVGGIFGFLAFFALISMSIEMSKVRKLLERQVAALSAKEAPPKR